MANGGKFINLGWNKYNKRENNTQTETRIRRIERNIRRAGFLKNCVDRSMRYQAYEFDDHMVNTIFPVVEPPSISACALAASASGIDLLI